jgi:hypothetical protein
MKNARRFLTLILGCFIAVVALGQELDDMYFNSKDRAKLNEGKIRADLGLPKNNTKATEANTPINPTDSYSARNINPEYSAQLNSGSTPVVEDNYFIPDFQPTGVNQNLSNCNCGSGSFYNPYFGNNAFNNPYYGNTGGFGSPYSSFYPSAWGNPYGYGSGLNMSLGYGWGGFNPGYYGGMGYGYNSYANNFWNPYNSWGGGFYNSYYPSQVIVIRNSDAYGRKTSYTKRSSRSSNINHDVDNSRYNSGSTVVTNGRNSLSGGRSRSATPEYYDRSWKRNQNDTPTRSYWNNMNTNGNATRSSFGDVNTNSGGRTSSGFTAPSRSSFNSGINSGGSRSSGSSGGSSGGSKTRGRNN